MELRQRQEREARYAHINGIKIHNQWRKIMRMAKACGAGRGCGGGGATRPVATRPLAGWQPLCTSPTPHARTHAPQVEELRRHIEVLSQSHEREVDRKDATLQVRMHATHACNARNARMQCTHACTAEQGCHAGCGEGPFTETHTHTHARAPHAPHAAADA